MRHGTLTLAIAGVALALAVPAAAGTFAPGAAFQLAQAQDDDHADHAGPGPGMTPGMGPGSGMMMRQQMGEDGKGPADKHRQHAQRMQQMCDTADAHHVATLAFSETRLKLTEAQKPAWSKFVEAATAAHQATTKLMCADPKAQTAPATLPDRLAREEQMAQAKLAHVQTLRPALLDFYKTLTPEQQKIADTLPLGGGHGRGGHRGGGQGW